MPVRVNTSVRFRVRPEARDEIGAEVEAGLIRGAQLVVADAMRESPYDTGHNARSLGWAASGLHKANFGILSTSRGDETSKGTKVANPQTVDVIVAGSSGYSGYLELKTKAYIMPALEKNRGAIMAELKGIL
ncbi:MAG: hypothetical protein V3U60_16255 [Gammaproteobacteria bacterium]